AISGEQRLWTEVLAAAIKEALTGEGVTGRPEDRIGQIEAARRYLTPYNRHFNTVCNLAELDPDALRDPTTPRHPDSPTPEALATAKRDRRGRLPKHMMTGEDHGIAA